ncbi:MAG: NAD(P)-binding domain-containing protein [Acidimicrobiales bacterium]
MQPPVDSSGHARAHDDRARGPSEGARWTPRGRPPLRGRGALHLQPHRGLRVRRAVPRRLPGRAGVPRPTGRARPEDVADHLYAHHDAEAVRHLFSVAAGLDSAVVGEHEILGQVRDAWERARAEGTVGATLGGLFRHAVETGKRARTETSIARGIASVSQAAVALAADRIQGIAGRSVLVIGAGEMAEGTVKSLAKAGAREVLVANRTWERAVALAEACDGTAVPLSDLADALARIDVLVTTTGAQDLILAAADVSALAERRDTATW